MVNLSAIVAKRIKVDLETPINSFTKSSTALREAKTDSPEFKQMVEDVRVNGVLKPVIINVITDPSGKALEQVLIDGAQRTKASELAGYTTVPAIFYANLTQEEQMDIQASANAHSVPTLPSEYCQHLKKMLALDPSLTPDRISGRLSKPVSWVNRMLGIADLDADILKLVDGKVISTQHALSLAKLKEGERGDFLTRAKEMTADVFDRAVLEHIKAVRAAARTATKGEAVFTPIPHMRKKDVLEGETQSPHELLTVKADHVKRGAVPTNAEDAFLAGMQEGVRYAIHMDSVSLSVARANFDMEQAKKKADAEKKKKAAEAARAAAEEAAKKGEPAAATATDSRG
jgi:ParB/RepB/Spo0J family partition protein